MEAQTADASRGRSRGEAFRTLVEPEIPVMLRVARGLTGSAADAEDAVQESLIRAYRALDTFDGAYPRAWLLTILRNTSANMYRRKRPDLVQDWDITAQHSRPAFGAERPVTPEDATLEAILDEDLESGLAALDPRFRSVLVLVDIHGLSYAECAQALGIPIGTVMSRLSRARDRIRAHLLTAGRQR